MKKVIYSAFVVLALLSCGNRTAKTTAAADSDTDGSNSSSDDSAAIANEPATLSDIKVTTNGTINESVWTAGETASISLSRLPASMGEFKGLQQKIGAAPEGAVMLQLVAFELYHKSQLLGRMCVELNNVDTNVTLVTDRLHEVYGKDTYYARPYLVASYLDGATPQNGYNPTKPYTIKVRTSAGRKYERSESLKGYILYLEAYSSGYDTSWRGCEVVKQKGNSYYKVSNSPAMYAQCKDIPFDAEKEYQGI